MLDINPTYSGKIEIVAEDLLRRFRRSKPKSDILGVDRAIAISDYLRDIITSIGIPQSRQKYDPTYLEMPRTETVQRTITQLIASIVEAEGGVFYADTKNNYIFRNRGFRNELTTKEPIVEYVPLESFKAGAMKNSQKDVFNLYNITGRKPAIPDATEPIEPIRVTWPVGETDSQRYYGVIPGTINNAIIATEQQGIELAILRLKENEFPVNSMQKMDAVVTLDRDRVSAYSRCDLLDVVSVDVPTFTNGPERMMIQGYTKKVGLRNSPWYHMEVQLTQPPPVTPVSYTHLTLPTICSV